MPAVSKKQQRFFGYLLSNPEERKKKGISKKAAQDFAQDVKEEKKSCPEGQYYCFDMGKCRPIPKGKKVRADGELVSEVAPPGWGHTKAEKEKTKPWKPKSKIGGSAAAFKKDLESGKFKGLPGSKTKKEKTADMFKIMWAAKKKGYKPHYKPGTDKKYKKYQKESTMPNVDPKDKKVIKDRAKTLFKQDLKGEVRGVNEAVKGQDTESRKEGAKERATEKRAHDAWKKRPGTTKRPLYSTTRHTKKGGDDYATQQKQSIKWHDQRTKGKFIPGTTTNEDTENFSSNYQKSLSTLDRHRGPEAKKDLAKKIGQRRKKKEELSRLVQHYKDMKSGVAEGKTWKDFKTAIDRVRGRKQNERNPQMDSTTRKLHKWRTDKEQKEREKYVTFTKPVEDD